ncbi:Leucine-rich repeat-containing G-protein coupled receptor 5 [Nymphon striatum]|nr:Leucine-rich repeat-containing G-protein coupled receptor 5 [Nymphon striatum]
MKLGHCSRVRGTKKLMMEMVIERFALILLCLIVKIYGINTINAACPPADSITPCVCEYRHFMQVPIYEIYCKDTKDLIPYTFSNVRKNIAIAMKGQFIRLYPLKFEYLLRLYDEIFKNLTVSGLEITDSNITEISDNVFNGNENSLNRLYIGKSNLKKIPVGALKTLTNLQVLVIKNSQISKLELDELPSTVAHFNFNGNQINSIEKDVFAKFHNLLGLDLDDNMLSSFSTTTPKSLFLLSFKKNNLKLFPTNASRTMVDEGGIYLIGNEITSLPSETSMKNILQKKISVSLQGNDINCDCNTKWVLENQIDLNKFIPIINCGQNSGKRSSKDVSQLTQEDYSDC